MKKGLYVLSILFLIVCLMLCLLSLATASADHIGEHSVWSMIWLLLGGLGFVIFMYEWDIVLWCLVVLLAVIVVSFVYAIRKKMLTKSTIVIIAAINSVSLILIAARAIGWFMIYSSI